MGSSASHHLHSRRYKDIKGTVKAKMAGISKEERKHAISENSTVEDRKKYTEHEEEKVYKFEDYDCMYSGTRERNQKSFYTPKSNHPGIKRPNMTLPSLEELDQDSPSSEETNLEEGEPNELNSTEISTIHQTKRQKYSDPSRRQSEDVSDLSSFMDFSQARKRPKSKFKSGKNLGTF